MNPLEESNERLKRLRNGEEVPCKHCKDGIIRPVGDCKKTHCFKCDKCKSMINLD